MPGTVLDPEDTDKSNMLPLCSKNSLCNEEHWKWSMATPACRCSDKRELIAHKVAGRERCGSAIETWRIKLSIY